MKKSSINFKAVTSFSEQHNQRIIVPDYVISPGEKTPGNISVSYESISDRLASIKSLYTEKVRQKWQVQMTPIKEAVIVLDQPCFLDSDGRASVATAEEKINKLSKRLEKEYGISCFQYYIHFDEGKEERGQITNVWERNLHAHMVFDWQNKKTGRMAKLGKAEMRDIQTITAEELGLERGKEFSKAERLEHGEYRERMKVLDYNIIAKRNELQKVGEDLLAKKQKRSQLTTTAQNLTIRLNDLNKTLQKLKTAY
jgi:hypothetical protein